MNSGCCIERHASLKRQRTARERHEVRADERFSVEAESPRGSAWSAFSVLVGSLVPSKLEQPGHVCGAVKDFDESKFGDVVPLDWTVGRRQDRVDGELHSVEGTVDAARHVPTVPEPSRVFDSVAEVLDLGWVEHE
jgi:hypothetical protein